MKKVKVILANGAIYSAKIKAGKTVEETINALLAKYGKDTTLVEAVTA